MKMRLTRNPGLVTAEMDGDIVMMNVDSGAYYGLTGVGPDIWAALDHPRSVDDLLDHLLPRYEVTAEMLRQDLEVFLTDMQKNGLVRPA
jgi:shikimate kinase